MAILDVVRCLVKELNAVVNQASENGPTSLRIVAEEGKLDVVWCLVKELDVAVNGATHKGYTPWAVAVGNQIRTLSNSSSSAARRNGGRFFKIIGAQAEQTQYLEAKVRRGSPGCDGAGVNK
jgi:hypothetical protein